MEGAAACFSERPDQRGDPRKRLTSRRDWTGARQLVGGSQNGPAGDSPSHSSKAESAAPARSQSHEASRVLLKSVQTRGKGRLNVTAQLVGAGLAGEIA